MYGPTGVVAGAAAGLIRTLHCDKKANAAIIPVDMCVNTLIAAAWEVGKNFKNRGKMDRIPVYNYESNSDQVSSENILLVIMPELGIVTKIKKSNCQKWFLSLVDEVFIKIFNISPFNLQIFSWFFSNCT